MFVSLLLAGCGATWDPRWRRPWDLPVPGEDGALTTDTGVPPRAEDTVPDQPEALDDWLYTPTTVHTVSVTLGAEAVASLAGAPRDHVHGDVVIDGYALADVGVRLRGKYGSFRTLDGKPKLELTFNEWVEDQRFFGLESISLNNSVVDCSMMKESLAYEVFRRAGVPAERTSYAEVTINGSPYGLYTVIETPDDRFLERGWAAPDGNLYDGKYILWDDGSYTLLDFATGVDTLFGLEEGTDVGHADIAAVSGAVAASAGTADWYGTTGAVVDWPAVHAMLAGEQWVGQNDGYALNTNNYRVYFDPADGRAELVPWDMDYSFLYDWQWGMSWATPRGQLAAGCWRDASCAAAQRLAVAQLLDAIDPADLAAWFAAVDAATWDASQRDPRQECGAGSVRSARDTLLGWVWAQNDALRATWGL